MKAAVAKDDAPSREAEPPSTLKQLYETHAARVWRVLRRLGVAEADVPDLCQEVFLVAHRRWDDFEGRSSRATWLYGIAWRLASDHRRKRQRRCEVPLDEARENRLSTPPEQERHSDVVRMRAEAHRILAAMEEKQRAVFVLYELEGLTMREVTQILGCPLQTGYTRLHAARRRFQEAARAWRQRQRG